MNREDIVKYLSLLGQRLKDRDICGEMIIVGGAVMSLVHSAREMTRDIDALYEPKGEIAAIAQEIAEEYGLTYDWINDGVKGFISETVETEVFACFGGLKVSVATAEYMLAMKLMASRGDTHDIDDIRYLLQHMMIESAKDALAVVECYYPQDRIPIKVVYMLEEIFGEKA